MDYLPLIGRKAAYGGTMGSDADGYGSSTLDYDGPKSYSVTTVDIYITWNDMGGMTIYRSSWWWKVE